MSEFLRRAVGFAQEIADRQQTIKELMSTPIAVAGLADTVKNAIAGMARAKHSADALGSSSQRLVGNVAQVDALKEQLDSANQQLEAAIEAVGAPLESPSSSGNGSAGVSPQSVPQADTSSTGAPPAAHDAATQEVPAQGGPTLSQSISQVQDANSVR